MSAKRQYWLLKSEPSVFGIGDLKASRGRRTHWDGVRNFQARNYLRDGMRVGDLAFFYHSNCPEPGIAGIVSIVKSGYPDPTQFDPKDAHFDTASKPDSPRWYMVDVRFERELSRAISLAELKRYAGGRLSGLPLLRRGNRLSVMPVSAAHWRFITSLE